MIYDAVEAAHTALAANFAGDYAALATAKSVTVTPVAGFVKRQVAETFVALGAVLPAIGVYALGGRSQAKHQAQRYTDIVMVFDYFGPDADPVRAQKQAELVAEALLVTIDKLWPSVSGAGEEPRSIEIELDPAYEKIQEPLYGGRAIVRFPLTERDTGL